MSRSRPNKDGAPGGSWLSDLPKGSGKLQDYLTKAQTSPRKKYSSSLDTGLPRRPLGGASGTVSSQREKFQALNSASSSLPRRKVPVFDKELSDVNCSNGDRVTLECHVSGNPPPKVTWYKNDEPIKYHKDYRTSQVAHIAKLSIISASASDEAQFSCTAVNSEGEATTTCYVYLDGPGLSRAEDTVMSSRVQLTRNGGQEESPHSRTETYARSRHHQDSDEENREEFTVSSARSTITVPSKVDSSDDAEAGHKIARTELVIPAAKRTRPKEDDLNISDPNLPCIKSLNDEVLRVNQAAELVINTRGRFTEPTVQVTTNKVITSVEIKQDSNNNTGITPKSKSEKTEIVIFPDVGETDVDTYEARKIELVTPAYDSKLEENVRVTKKTESVVTSQRRLGNSPDVKTEIKRTQVSVASVRDRNGIHERTNFTAKIQGDEEDGSRRLRMRIVPDGEDESSTPKTSSSRSSNAGDDEELEKALNSVAMNLQTEHNKSQSLPRSSFTTSEDGKATTLPRTVQKTSDETKSTTSSRTFGVRNRFLEADMAGKDLSPLKHRNDIGSPKKLDLPIRMRDGGSISSRMQKFEVNLKNTDQKPKGEIMEARLALKKTASPKGAEGGKASWQRQKFESDSSASPFVAKSKGLSALRRLDSDDQPTIEYKREEKTFESKVVTPKILEHKYKDVDSDEEEIHPAKTEKYEKENESDEDEEKQPTKLTDDSTYFTSPAKTKEDHDDDIPLRNRHDDKEWSERKDETEEVDEPPEIPKHSFPGDKEPVVTTDLHDRQTSITAQVSTEKPHIEQEADKIESIVKKTELEDEPFEVKQSWKEKLREERLARNAERSEPILPKHGIPNREEIEQQKQKSKGDDELQDETKANLRKARLARMAEILAKAKENDLWEGPKRDTMAITSDSKSQIVDRKYEFESQSKITQATTVDDLSKIVDDDDIANDEEEQIEDSAGQVSDDQQEEEEITEKEVIQTVDAAENVVQDDKNELSEKEQKKKQQEEDEKNTIQNISDLLFTADPSLTNGVEADMSERSRRYTRESKPSFIIKPRRQFVDEGQVAKFKASFDGEPQPKVKWAYNNNALSDGQKYKIYEKNDFHFLEVNDVQEEDKGTYAITISNHLGHETMSAELEVFVKSKLTRAKKTSAPPKFEKELADMVAKDGDRVTLECTVTGTPEPTINWFFNKKLLKSSNEITQSYNGRRAKLTFVEVFPDDKGFYECVASNTGGEVRSSCTLTVEGLNSATDVKNGEEKPPEPVEIAPAFTKYLENLTAQDGSMVALECNVTGTPQPKVIWYKAGAQIKPSEDFIMTYDGNLSRLLIQEVYPEDEGEYKCVAENSAGEARTKCKLIVKVPEQGKEEPASPTPKSAPPPRTAPKPPGKKTSDTNVPGGNPPKIVKKLKDLTVNDGDRVELVVDVEGTGPLEAVWLHGEKEIKKTSAVYELYDEGNIHRLVVPEVYPEDSGVYTCEIYSEFGDADTSMTLTVNDKNQDGKGKLTGVSKNGTDGVEGGEDDEFYPPEFIRKPRSVNVDEGTSAKFQCQIDAYPPPTVSWEKDGKILENGGRFKIIEDGEMFSFEIPHTLATDAGRYVVIATNSLGTEKYSVSLMVKEIESTEVTDFRGLLKTSRPKLQTLGSGGDASRFQDNECEQLDFRNVLQQNATTSKKAKVGQIEADYKVQPDAEQVDFRNVLTRHVKTKSRPTVKKELRDVQVREGEPVKLECTIMGIPMPEIRWFHGKKEIKESKYFKMTFERGVATLHMAEVYPEDEGEYLCMAVNSAGNVHSSCDVKVIDRGDEAPRERRPVNPAAMEPPLIEDLQPDNLHILRGTLVQLKAKFAGEPRPNVVWTHGRRKLNTGGRIRIDVVRDTTTLTINDSQPDDSGIYTLSVDNELGCDTCNSSLTVEDKPNPPAGQPAATNISGNSLTLSWYGPSYDGGSPVTDYRVEILKVGEVDWKTLTSNCKYTSFQVRNLEKNTEYLFRVSAANKHGFSDPGKISEVIVTIDRRRSSSTKLAIDKSDSIYDTIPSPLSPEAYKALRDELAFEPREVSINSDRVFKDYYVLSDEIGKGRFGSVCLCIEKSSGRELAVKFIKVKATERDEARQEINIMNQLHHPKLLMLYDAFQTPREVILIMEHIAGGELFERIIDDDYVLTERECVHFMRQIIDGVRFMHEKNILHLDLKPENILCVTRNSNEIKIIDFGLARKFDPKKNFRVLFGTPEFVAPEVINYDQISYPTDMWSVGVICYILISGLSPFLGDNDTETLANVTAAQWDFEDDAFNAVSQDAKNFIESSLTKNMRRRLTAAKALAHPWLAQDVKFMKAKRLSTERHKRFLARRRWQKTGHAIRALGRLSIILSSQSFGDASSRSSHSRQGSLTSESTSSVFLPKIIADMDELKITSDPQDTMIGASTEPTEIYKSQNGNEHETDKSSTSLTETADLIENSDSKAEEIVSTSTEENIPLSEMESPNFIRKMRDIESLPGEPALFRVKVKGEPAPVVSWYKDGAQISEGPKYKLERENMISMLYIMKCDQSDSAVYECHAQNPAGVITCQAKLHVDMK